ncbi:hypothetical protein A2U01_0107013, partial [Trifolium medium]|nr:hypothetical protein [Trifolium medium]
MAGYTGYTSGLVNGRQTAGYSGY